MSRTVKPYIGPNRDRVAHVLERRRSNAAGPHASKRRVTRGGRNGAKVALRREFA